MQLRKDAPIRGALAALTAALLGHQAAGAGEPMRTETSLLLYSESERVTAGEAMFKLRRQLSEPYTLHLSVQFDVLTGASPTGATPARTPQTFTRPSGNGGYTIAAGETPLDPGFKDNRVAIDADVSRAVNRLLTLNLGGHLSVETDYTSAGVTAGLTRDFNRKNTTIGLSGSFSRDVARPRGGSQDAFTPMAPPSEGDDRAGYLDDDEDEVGAGYEPKNVYDLVLGVSQVIDRETLIRLNYSFDYATGHLSDPYKILSVVQNAFSADAGDPIAYLYEGRPSSRTKQAIYAEVLRHIHGSILDFSFRHFWDDWGVRSETADLFWRLPIHGGQSVEPHVRWYNQTRADFYHPFLVNGNQLPDFASADARLADFDALTFGLKYSIPVMNGSHLSATAEYYLQKGDSSPPEAFGNLLDYGLFPDLHALMVRIGFTRDF